ncbi:MAG: kelch repeat-containing protein [Planctomycetota bacterium]
MKLKTAALASVALLSVLHLAAASELRVEPTTTLAEGVASFGACADGAWLYVYGGHTGRAHQHSLDNLSHTFRRLSLLDGVSWQELPAGPPMQSVALVAHKGSVYRVGGLLARNRAGEDEDLWSSNEVARFDTVLKKWIPLPSLPERRSSHDACVLGDKIYVFAGWTLGGKRTWLDTAYTMDLNDVDAGWEPLPTAPFERRAVDVTAHDGKLYVIGGITSDGDLSSDVDVFDPASGAWSFGPTLPGRGFGASAAVQNGRLIASGMDGVLFRLSTDGKKWVQSGRLAIPRFFHRYVPLPDGRLACVSGAARGGHVRWIEYVQPQSHEGPSLATLLIPFPGQARNRQAAYVEDNTIYLFGGNNSLSQHDFEPENFVRAGYRVSLASLEAQPVADFPIERQSHALAAYKHGKSRVAYAIGGFGHDGKVARSHADLFRYDLKSNQWNAAAMLPEPRTQFGSTVHDDKLWVFGGLDYEPGRESGVWKYPLPVVCMELGDKVQQIPTDHALPRPRRAFGGAQLGNNFYLIGGMRENFTIVPECDVFNFDTGQWSTIPAPARPRLSPQVVPFEGRLYLIGGSSPKGDEGFESNRSIEVFDPQAKQWSLLVAKVPFSVRHAKAAALKHRIAIYSTHREGPAGLQVSLLDPGLSRLAGPTSRPKATRSSL